MVPPFDEIRVIPPTLLHFFILLGHFLKIVLNYLCALSVG